MVDTTLFQQEMARYVAFVTSETYVIWKRLGTNRMCPDFSRSTYVPSGYLGLSMWIMQVSTLTSSII